MEAGSSWVGGSHVESSSACWMSGVEGQLNEASSSEVILPSNDGAEVELGIRAWPRCCSCDSTAGDNGSLIGGDKAVADLSFSIVGHSEGEGMLRDGYRCGLSLESA